MSSAVKLLVSVRNAAEAADALAGGVDWIDLKEPRRGPLGAVDPAAAQAIVAAVGHRVPVSAAAGELADLANQRPGNEGSLRRLLAAPGISHLKLGLSQCAEVDWRPQWAAARDEVHAAGRQLVAVIYADSDKAKSPLAEEILDVAILHDSPWVLWDTFDKSGDSIDQLLGVATLREQLTLVRSAGLRTVVAGRVDASRLACLPLELIDMIAVRGAVCRGLRESAVCPQCVASLRAAISRHTDCRANLHR